MPKYTEDEALAAVLEYSSIPAGAFDSKVKAVIKVAEHRLQREGVTETSYSDKLDDYNLLWVLASCHYLFVQGIINKANSRSGGDVSESFDSTVQGAIGHSPFEREFFMVLGRSPFINVT